MTILLQDEWLTMHLGDARSVLAELEADSIQSVITSPPYYGLRSYPVEASLWGGDPAHDHAWGPELVDPETRGEEGSELEGTFTKAARFDRRRGMFCGCGAWCGVLGLEPDPAMYVDHIVEVFRAVRRVLRPDGTLWLNIGDTYADRANRRSDAQSFRQDRKDVVPGKLNTIGGSWALKAKDRMMIPARVAIALQTDGWFLRDEIVWAKGNAMPSSVGDRTTPAHEMVYLLAKRGRYYFDNVAIREHGVETRPEALAFGERRDIGYPGKSDRRHQVKVPGGWDVTKGEGGHGSIHREGRTEATYTDRRRPRGWDHGPDRGHDRGIGRYQPPEGYEKDVVPGRNKRSVWKVSTQAYPDAHYATFPEKLIEPMILAGCPRDGLVLDPFAGSGTVGLVAQRLHRRAVLIDLSEEYLGQAIERIAAGRSAGEGPAIDMPVPFADDGLWATPPAEAVS